MPETAATKVILCVDDHVPSLMLRKLILENAGFTVVTAENATDGLARLQESHVDLAIVDYYLPDMDGTKLAIEIKTQRPGLKILMMSGSIEEPGMRDSVDGFLTKGGPTREFLDLVRKLIA